MMKYEIEVCKIYKYEFFCLNLMYCNYFASLLVIYLLVCNLVFRIESIDPSCEEPEPRHGSTSHGKQSKDRDDRSGD